MSTEITKVHHAELVEREPERVTFSAEERKLIREYYARAASEAQFAALIAIAEARGLDPRRGECHFVERGGKWSVQPSIDYFRSSADASGLYDGQDEPEYEHDPKTGRLVCAKVRVWRKGWSRPIVGVARFDEFQAGGPMWTRMPHNQLAKCAESQALRKAFPRRLGGLYTADEMAQADHPAAHAPLNLGATAPQLPPRPASEPPPPAEDHRTPEHRERKAAEGLLFARLRDAMLTAPDLEALAKIRDELRSAKLNLSMDHWADLGALGKARKDALERPARGDTRAETARSR